MNQIHMIKQNSDAHSITLRV